MNLSFNGSSQNIFVALCMVVDHFRHMKIVPTEEQLREATRRAMEGDEVFSENFS